jgi:hypothetical protein
MTNLSPAAQQVFWEFNRAASGKPDDWHYLPAIAAALRAAAQTLAYEIHCPGEGWYELVIDANDLYAIAAELEGNA